jgi:hypothetical protein
MVGAVSPSGELDLKNVFSKQGLPGRVGDARRKGRERRRK